MRTLTSVLALVPVLSLVPLASPADGPYQYHPLTPCRAVDTRLGNGGTLLPSADRPFAIQSVCGVPSGAKAASVNVTVVATGGAGYLALYPSNVTRPATFSTINFVKNDIVANGAIVPLGTTSGGDLRVFANTTGNVEMILDVSGYFQ